MAATAETQLEVLNPATGESIATVPNMSADEVDAVVDRPAGDGGLEGGAGAGRGQRPDPEAGGADTAVASPVPRAGEGRAAGGRAPGRDRRRRADRPAPGRAS